MHLVPSGCVAPEAPQQIIPFAQSAGDTHSRAPPSAQADSARQDSSGTAPVRWAQHNVPAIVSGQSRPQAAPLLAPVVVPELLPPELLPPELDPVGVPPLEELDPVGVPPLLELGPDGPVVLFDPQPEASASAAATPAPIDAKNSTCAFLMGKP
jgi:hypothetical protein